MRMMKKHSKILETFLHNQINYPWVGPYCKAAVISFLSRFIVVPPLTLTERFSNGNIPGFGTPPARNTKLGDPWVKSFAE